MTSDDRAQIARLEAMAARHPVAYRWRVGALAIAGDLALTMALIAPLALPIIFGAMVLNHPLFLWLAAAAVLFFAWLMRPKFRWRGRRLEPQEAPVLFSEIDALRDKLQVAGRLEVGLDGSFNAGAVESRGLFGLLGTQRILLLGVPLLATLSREQVLGVIAHELGHFSRRHGRLGHWLYRARVSWIVFASQVHESDSILDRAAAAYADWFVPYFSRLSFVHSRQCEYEADADAAAATGSKAFAEALTRVAVLSRLWDDGFPRALARLQQADVQAPADFYERFAAAAGTWPAPELERWQNEALAAPSGLSDTHPGLAARLRALGEDARLGPAPGHAGIDLMGETWPKILAELNAQWHREAQWHWTFEHLRFKHVTEPLLKSEGLARAKALRQLSPAEGLAELRRLHDLAPDDPAVTFTLGAALLNENDAAGASLLPQLAQDHPQYRVPTCDRLLTYYGRNKDERQVERWSKLLQRAAAARAASVEAFMERVERGEAGPSTLAEPIKTAVAKVASSDTCVERAWLAEGDEYLATDERSDAAVLKVHALILTVDPTELERRDAGEDTVVARYREAMEVLIGPDQAAEVRTYYTTEPLPETLRRYTELRR